MALAATIQKELPRLMRKCLCASCQLEMDVGEPFEWVQKTYTTKRAFNSGHTLTKTVMRPRHPYSSGCGSTGWSHVGGGYDQSRVQGK